MKRKQLQRVLVAYDSSPGAEIALNDLQQAGLPTEAQALIVCVADVWVPPHDEKSGASQTDKGDNAKEQETPDLPQIPEALALRQRSIESARRAIQEAREVANEGRAHTHALFPHWQVRAEACADSPAWGVLNKASKWHPDLVVVGATSHSLIENLRFGSTAQKVVAQARSSVRVGRTLGKKAGTPLRLLLGLDGSPDAQAALCSLATRQWPQGSEVRVFTVLDQRMGSVTVSSIPYLARWMGNENCDKEFAWAYRMAHNAAEQLRSLGLDASWTVQEGDPKHALIEEARRWEADCIFLGSQGLVGLSGLHYLESMMIGSTATVVAAHAPCSVEVARRDIPNAL